MSANRPPAVLLTGSTGMLGRALQEKLGPSYSLIKTSKRGLEGSIPCDLSDETQVRGFLEKHPADLVIHTAAYSDVDGCERDPKLAYEANAMAPKNLAAFCGAKNIPWIHVSTDYVFDGRKRPPDMYTENDTAAPSSIYGMTKWVGEFYAAHSASPCAIVRTSWLFGPGNPKTFVNWVSGRLKTESTAAVLDDQTTAPTSVKDLSEALARIAASLLETKSPRVNRTFHVCNRGGTTHLGIAEFIREKLGLRSAKVEVTDKSRLPGRLAIRPVYSVMDPENFEKSFGMKMRPWKDALREYIQENGA